VVDALATAGATAPVADLPGVSPPERHCTGEVPPGEGGVSLRREGTSTELGKVLGRREIEVPDPLFDQVFFVGGLPALVYAFLDAETRGILLRLNQEGVLTISGPEIGLDLAEGDEGLLPGELPLLLKVAERLSDRHQTPERLATNARQDPLPGVRLKNLLCLVRELGEHPLVDETLRAACADLDPEVRLRAAAVLGRDGAEILLEMTEDMGVSDAWAAAAVTALGLNLPFDRAAATLDRALHGHRYETARACIEALRHHGKAAVEPLVKPLMVDAGMVAAAAARALGALEASSTEGLLVRALWRSAPGLRLAAAEALGRAGSVAAVPPLKQIAENNEEPEFRQAARQAIARIQARLPGASPGQLSLAAAEAGQLSLAGSGAGRLSFPHGEAGELSLARPPGGGR
jgi:HEAT repeats